jgi:hypothetical protein
MDVIQKNAGRMPHRKTSASPKQASDALGAAASQLGPDAQAAVVDLNKNAGLAHGKVSTTFRHLFGITLSRGGSAHVVLRAGRRCQPVYQAICRSLGRSSWVVPDETGWRVAGRLAWLHGFFFGSRPCQLRELWSAETKSQLQRIEILCKSSVSTTDVSCAMELATKKNLERI